MCQNCADVRGQRVCGACWAADWQSSCFQCKTALPTTKTWETRYCRSCYEERFCAPDVDSKGAVDTRCFYCKSDGDGVATRSCAHADDCPGHVNVCDRCVAIHNKVVCSGCWLRH